MLAFSPSSIIIVPPNSFSSARFAVMIDTNQNDKISVLELNKFSKEGGMVAGLNRFLESSKGVDS